MADPPGTRRDKVCPRCGRTFACLAAHVERCDCMRIPLTPAATASVRARYDDCLCGDCLRDLSAGFFTPHPDAESGTTLSPSPAAVSTLTKM
ncbi:cysteine-rich CWC family protein [Imhoffiella purpurea]